MGENTIRLAIADARFTVHSLSDCPWQFFLKRQCARIVAWRPSSPFWSLQPPHCRFLMVRRMP
jgi:hypothetical protein